MDYKKAEKGSPPIRTKIWSPVRFHDEEHERERILSLAKARLDAEQQQRREENRPPAKLEEFFPNLLIAVPSLSPPCYPVLFDGFEDQMELEAQRLRRTLDNLGSIPLTELAIGFEPNWSIPEPVYLPAPGDTIRPENRVVAAEIMQLSQTRTPSEVSPTMLDTATEPAQKPSRRTPDKAYAVTQALLGKVTIKILGEAIYTYSGRFYTHISAEMLRRLIMGICREAIESEGNARLVDEVYRLLLCEPRIAEQQESIDSRLVSFRNGVLNLDNLILMPHDSRFNTYYTLEADYGPGLHPNFDRFLTSITGGDLMLQQRILEIIGYCLTPDLSAKSFFVFQGVPDSGKSLLAAFIRGCFNQEATVAQDILSLGDRFAAATLIGKQLCTSMDLPSSELSSKAVSVFKMFTGGDPLTADVKYRPAITFFNRAKFIFGSNHQLITQNFDQAFYNRAVTVPFLYSVPKECQDHALLQRLESERGAIIYTALQAYQGLRANQYRFSGNYPLNEIFNYGESPVESTESLLQDFIRNHFEEDPKGEVYVSNIFDLFNAEHGSIITIQQFSTRFLLSCATLGLQNIQKLSKKRPGPGTSPQARIGGLRLKPETVNDK